MIRIITLILLALASSHLYAQTTTDAVMMKKGETCIAVVYDQGSFDHYWEGDDLRTNGTIAEVTRYAFAPMVSVGIHEKINFLFSVPYIRTKSSVPNGGYYQGQKGFQDFSVAVKGEIIKQRVGTGELTALATIGFSTPASGYLSDYRPYSIGFGANEVSLRGIAQYEFEGGIFVRGALAYLWRGQTEVDRDYYYANGSHYTRMMDVPSAWNYHGVVGVKLLQDALIIEGSYVGLNSTSGDDIRKYNAPQPTNEVDAGQVGVQVQYYLSQPKGLGVLGYFYEVVSGRNVGKVSGFGVGITYAFQL